MKDLNEHISENDFEILKKTKEFQRFLYQLNQKGKVIIPLVGQDSGITTKLGIFLSVEDIQPIGFMKPPYI